MDLIIKPTEACNFKCTFCSSTNIASDKTSILPLNMIETFLKRFPDTGSIIVNGGDPLMVNPKYYWQIIDMLDAMELQTNISMTSNLWSFYKNPEMWTELFNHKRVAVCTSFNYGETRRITKDRVFTEHDFMEISDLFLSKIGYRPDFISVINYDNEDTALDNVRLAQKLNVVCKLNYAMASGDQKDPFILARIYKIYLDIVDQGLTRWEFNTQQMIKRMAKKPTICPQNRSCDSGIRCLQPKGDYYSCGAFGDDKEYTIDFFDEMNSKTIASPISNDLEIQYIKQDCLVCPMFEICNGCKKTVKDLKRSQLAEIHCEEMKSIAPRIIALRNNEVSTQRNFGEIYDFGR
jgi:radical SAM protein with 4Fe4S-binding SPASM domain